ncbi:MAG TPA: hypothetical protein VKY19_01205 [Ktedonosporobacter sp.]|jgi:hypothetical protein|nr:hypothetical protein [Ktedonosporobacter sp.]
MKNRQPPGGAFEHNEQLLQHIRTGSSSEEAQEEQVQLDYLMESGFEWGEAVKLLCMREHLYENSEVRQRMADDLRTHFVRWLYEHGEISEI